MVIRNYLFNISGQRFYWTQTVWSQLPKSGLFGHVISRIFVRDAGVAYRKLGIQPSNWWCSQFWDGFIMFYTCSIAFKSHHMNSKPNHPVEPSLNPSSLGPSTQERVESGAADDEMVVLKGLRKVLLGFGGWDLMDGIHRYHSISAMYIPYPNDHGLLMG